MEPGAKAKVSSEAGRKIARRDLEPIAHLAYPGIAGVKWRGLKGRCQRGAYKDSCEEVLPKGGYYLFRQTAHGPKIRFERKYFPAFGNAYKGKRKKRLSLGGFNPLIPKLTFSVKKVLITGGAGFLGSHLCDRFIHEGYHVIAMDNLLTGSMRNIEHLFPLPQFEFYHYDVTRFVHVPGSLDYILHFASPASPIDYLKMPIQTLKVGALGTHNLLGLAREKKARILVASTSEVYGDPLEHPQSEDYWGNVNPVGPRGVYDEAKRFLEAITMAYHNFHGVDTRIVRIFNTYGPRMRVEDGRVLPAFFSQAIRGEGLTVFGDGSQTRSFCYVDDLVEGIFRLLMSEYHLPVNIGNPDEINILEFAREIITLVGNPKAYIDYRPLPVDDPKVRQPDIARAKAILGWEPQVPRAQGLLETMKYFKEVVH